MTNERDGGGERLRVGTYVSNTYVRDDWAARLATAGGKKWLVGVDISFSRARNQ